MALIWSNASFIFRKRGWRHHVLSNGRVSTATSSDVPSLQLSPWLSSVVIETERKSPFSLGWTEDFGGWFVVMGAVRAPTAAAVCVSRLECLKLEWTRGNLGTRTLSSSSSLISPHPAEDRQPALSAARCCSLSSGAFLVAPTGSPPAARAAEWIPPCSSSCCTWWSRTSWSAAGCSTGDRAPSPANELLDLCCAQGACACVRASLWFKFGFNPKFNIWLDNIPMCLGMEAVP